MTNENISSSGDKMQTGNNQAQNVIIHNSGGESNGLGTAGFTLSIIGLFIFWVPLFGQLIWFLGFLFSLIGVFKKPRGLSIAGLIISFIDLIILMIIIGGISSAMMK